MVIFYRGWGCEGMISGNPKITSYMIQLCWCIQKRSLCLILLNDEKHFDLKYFNEQQIVSKAT